MTADQNRTVWLFDIDGTIVDSFDAQHLRPLVTELFAAIRANGATVAVWSAGGIRHATRVLARHGLAEQVEACFDKAVDDGGMWVLPTELDAGGTTVVCVDDQPAQLPLAIDRHIIVFPYLGADPHDRALLDALQSLSAGSTATK